MENIPDDTVTESYKRGGHQKKNQLISAGHLFNNQIARYQCPQTAGQKKNVLISFRFPDIDAVVYQRPGLNND
jgi:hypothetical protein